MSKEKHIDDLFREKLREREFGFDEKSWRAAEKLIIAGEKKAAWYGGKGFWFGLSIVATIAVLVPFVMKNEQGKPLLSSIPEQKASLSEQKDILSEQKDFIPGKKDILSEQKDILPGISAAEKGILSGKKDIIQEQNDIIAEGSTVIPEHSGVIPERPGSISEQKEPLNKSFGKNDKPEMFTSSGIEHLPLEKMDYLSFYGFDYSEDKNVVSGLQPLKDRLNWLRRVDIGLIGGANISQGFINTGPDRAGPSTGPLAGLRFAYALNNMVSLGTNVLYHIRGGLNSEITASDLDSSKILGLTEFTTTTTTPLRLHYLDFPIYLNYRNNRHSFLIGLQYSHLLTSYNKVRSVTKKNDTVLDDTTGKELNNTRHFAPYDVAGVLGYDYVLNEKIDIGARLNYGLYDITDDQSFGTGVSIDKNLQLRLLLTYKLLRY